MKALIIILPLVLLINCNEPAIVEYYEGEIISNPQESFSNKTSESDTTQIYIKTVQDKYGIQIWKVTNNNECKKIKYKFEGQKVKGNWFGLNQYQNRIFFLDKSLVISETTPNYTKQELEETIDKINKDHTSIKFRYSWFQSMPQSFSGHITQSNVKGMKTINLQSESYYNTPAFYSKSIFNLEVMQTDDQTIIDKIELLINNNCT